MSVFMEKFAQYIREKGYNVFSAAEICGGESTQVQFVKTNRCQDSYSVAKAFVVTALGFLFDEGKVSPDDKVMQFFPDYAPADARWNDMTIDMALKHRVGLPGGFLDIDCVPMKEFGQDMLGYMFSQQLLCAPGEKYAYTDGAFYLLACIAQRLAGRELPEFMWERLFAPLGFTEMAWSACPHGHALGATGLYITAADMAKLGALYLNNGVWEGKRLLSEKWVETVLERGYELKSVGIGKAFGKGGMYNQMLIVVPETGRSVAWHAYEDDRDINKDLIRFCAEYR